MFFCVLFVLSLCASGQLCLVVNCWERADLLACLWCLTVSLSLSCWYSGWNRDNSSTEKFVDTFLRQLVDTL